MIWVFTGPAAGNVSTIASDWNRTTASVSIGWNTPHAPFHGSVCSERFKPSSFRPLTYASIQSLRLAMSSSKSPSKSAASSDNVPSSMNSARLASNSSPDSSSGSISISKPSIPTLTASGSSISISISGSASAASLTPSGAAYSPFSIAMMAPI